MPKKLILLFLTASCILVTIYWLKTKPTTPFLSPFINPPPITNHQSLITLIAVGDIMLGRNVNVKMQKYQNFIYPFEKTADFLKTADITFGNLESPFFENCPIVGTGTMKFCADYKAIEGLKYAGFDVLSLENNHISNYGKRGIDETKNLLLENNILGIDNNLTIKQVNNLSFGFFALDLTTQILTNPHDREQISIPKLVENEAKNVDVLVVSLHWGNEYQKEPTKTQKELARQMIEAGAKIIIGHHPHVIQPIELYREGLIFYSLGNFVFDQMWSEETRKGLVVKITFEGNKIKNYQTFPILISDYSQPDFLIKP